MIDFAKFESTPIPSRQFVSQSHCGAKVRGVYGILFDCGQLLLECSGWLEFDERFPVCMDGFDLLYVGASLDPLRRRVLSHLTGNTRTSSLRMTVGAILSRELELESCHHRGIRPSIQKIALASIGLRPSMALRWALALTGAANTS
jgi:hypothetical protein